MSSLTFFYDFTYRVNVPELLEIPEINVIATRLNKSPAQILLKWIIKRGVAAIPKSTNANRLRQNISLFDFDLTDDDMETIKKLDKGIRIVNFEFFQGYVLIVNCEKLIFIRIIFIRLVSTSIQSSHSELQRIIGNGFTVHSETISLLHQIHQFYLNK